MTDIRSVGFLNKYYIHIPPYYYWADLCYQKKKYPAYVTTIMESIMESQVNVYTKAVPEWPGLKQPRPEEKSSD